uniref:EF-hand domain-containing protein n=2 Tax=Cryptomonas curvata TaxID=233186 RepID=A0A7S0MS33_9CRYP|mmetsp:Transcript_52751/g.110066  ORF Transcript_52751/g.110066 Transcript_52751/m.110066 type:complete len:109 (+) Transcript_52751:393-719(+)
MQAEHAHTTCTATRPHNHMPLESKHKTTVPDKSPGVQIYMLNSMQTSPNRLNNQLEYTSFVAACLERQNYLEQTNLHDAFNRFRNEDGFITADSLRSILGDKFSTKEV